MFHLDIDQSTHALPLSQDLIAIGRYFIKTGDKGAFKSGFDGNKHELECLLGEDQMVGGYRVDVGYDPSKQFADNMEDFTLFTAWDSVENYFEFEIQQDS